MSTISIRFATKEDTPLILKFIKELADYEKLLDDVVATEVRITKTLFGDKPAVEVVFAEQDGQPVGFALFFHNYSTFLAQPGLYLEDLYVKPEARGQGIGKKILAFLAKLAQSRDCGRVEWYVLNWNTSAIEFYRSLGAVPLDEWTTFRLAGNALHALAKQSM